MGSAHAYLTKCQRPESTEREHMSGQEGRAPQAHLDLEDTRLRYNTYQLCVAMDITHPRSECLMTVRSCEP
jgi:hypothetical protein